MSKTKIPLILASLMIYSLPVFAGEWTCTVIAATSKIVSLSGGGPQPGDVLHVDDQNPEALGAFYRDGVAVSTLPCHIPFEPVPNSPLDAVSLFSGNNSSPSNGQVTFWLNIEQEVKAGMHQGWFRFDVRGESHSYTGTVFMHCFRD